jgi:hypothetical protein
MSAEPAESAGLPNVIQVGGEKAVVVPLDEYRVLAELRKRATSAEIDDAEMAAVIDADDAWEAAGRPGVKSHEEFMAEMFGGVAP